MNPRTEPCEPARNTPVALGISAISLLAISCAGPGAELHDVLDEASERVDATIARLEVEQTTIDEIRANAMELDPCVERYVGQPGRVAPYIEEIPKPDTLNVSLMTEMAHWAMCENLHESFDVYNDLQQRVI